FDEWLENNPEKKSLLSQHYLSSLPVVLHMQLHEILNQPMNLTLETKLINQWSSLPQEDQSQLCANLNSINPQSFSKVFMNSTLAKDCASSFFVPVPPTSSQLKDLITQTPDARNYANGKFYKKPKIFQFCRTNREYTCLMVIKNKDDQWVKTSQGKVWSQQKLSLSRYGKNYNERNGSTPSGVYTINGVMPYADNQPVYGRYRRLIIQFIPSSSSENLTKSLIPPSNHSANWWKEAVVARDMGRDLFRIHGTLRRNEDKSSTYYPFYPTAGCVATKEGLYDSVDYIDQRPLLDTLMTENELQPIYSNEPNILALFYVININGENRPVSLQDLEPYGIK
ncbi:MAG: hypothetical protein KDD34_02710, partial [Bdellovibrionales bacterium]|nr:hypothetical protein [Bdellovibrionales bacterium]